jgi:hypothetical protein
MRCPAQQILQRHKALQDIAILGMDEPRKDKLTVARARKIERTCPTPFTWLRCSLLARRVRRARGYHPRLQGLCDGMITCRGSLLHGLHHRAGRTRGKRLAAEAA